MKKRSNKPKIKKGAWFYPLRGSYFPCSWQGWAVELAIVVGFFAGLLAFQDQNIGTAIVAVVLLPYTLALGVIASWIAKQKS